MDNGTGIQDRGGLATYYQVSFVKFLGCVLPVDCGCVLLVGKQFQRKDGIFANFP